MANVDLKFNILLPMLRVSEAYYIAAECEENPAEGLKYLNSVLNNRGLESEKKEESVWNNKYCCCRENKGHLQRVNYYWCGQRFKRNR